MGLDELTHQRLRPTPSHQATEHDPSRCLRALLIRCKKFAQDADYRVRERSIQGECQVAPQPRRSRVFSVRRLTSSVGAPSSFVSSASTRRRQATLPPRRQTSVRLATCWGAVAPRAWRSRSSCNAGWQARDRVRLAPERGSESCARRIAAAVSSPSRPSGSRPAPHEPRLRDGEERPLVDSENRPDFSDVNLQPGGTSPGGSAHCSGTKAGTSKSWSDPAVRFGGTSLRSRA